MTVQAGYSYRCEIKVKVSLLAVKVDTVICMDTRERFHGSVAAMGKTASFSDGHKVGEDYLFSGTAQGVTAQLSCRLHADGSITGTAVAEGRTIKLTGRVLSEEKGIIV